MKNLHIRHINGFCNLITDHKSHHNAYANKPENIIMLADDANS